MEKKDVKVESSKTTDTPKELTKEQLSGMLHQMSEQGKKLFEEKRKSVC